MEDKANIKRIIIYTLISLFIIISCFLAFVLNYRWIYYIDYDVDVSVIVISCLSIVIAALLLSLAAKKIFKDNISLRQLLLISVLLPIACCGLNTPLLKPDFGKLYFMIEDSSFLYSLRIGDYDFNGISDSRDKILQDYHTEIFSESAPEENMILSSVSVTACGKGNLSKSSIEFQENSVVFDFSECEVMENASIVFHCRTQDIAQNTAVYLVDGETRKPLSVSCAGCTLGIRFEQMQELNGRLVFEF